MNVVIKPDDSERKLSQKKLEEMVDKSKFTVEVPVRMPDMGEGGGKVVKWHFGPGDIVQHGDLLCDIQTPDFTFAMETDDECLAVVKELLVEADGPDVTDNEVICILLHEPDKGDAKRTGAEPVAPEEKSKDSS